MTTKTRENGTRKRSSSSYGGSNQKSRRLSEEQIAIYMIRKAQKKAARVVAAGYYSNASNRFGDSNLSDKFVWKKKIEREVSVHGGITSYGCVYEAEKRRQKEIMGEIEKLKQRREERVVEKAARQSSGRREGEFEVDWEKKEKEFELEQSKLRTKIRLGEGRAKPIDILTKHLNDDYLDLAMEEPPYMVFKGLKVKEIEEVHDEIMIKLNLDLEDQYYWKAVLEVCNWELATATGAGLGEEEIISCCRGLDLHPSIEEDVRDYLQRKTHKELEEIQSRVEALLNSGMGKVVEFWQVLLQQIQLYKAKAFLREFHNSKIMHLPNHHHPSNLQQPTDDFDAAPATAMELVEEEEDETYDLIRRLRKPKYDNRVHSGYVWNKYNQTHYDHDNPPPKIVKGYKFNIFYPDLVDKTKAPTYTIEKDDESSSGETCIIRFHAGLPYQDIAFRIVNDDWELSLKKGFNCSFHNGILRLYFNFKRYPYRR